MSHELNYPAARNNDHGWSDDVILVQIAGDVQVAILGVSVAKQPAGLPRRFETLSEREPVVVVAIPAPESRYVPSPKLLQNRSLNTIINEINTPPKRSLTNKNEVGKMEEILVHAYIHWQGGNLVGGSEESWRDRLLRSDMVFQRLCSSSLN